MTYDFDMISVTPKDFQRKFARLLARLGLTDQAGEQIAMFRDPHATWALSGASEAVRDCFVSSGFALNCRQSTARAGEFAATDQDARRQVLVRLRENVDALPEDADWNGFDIDAFFAEAYAASPAEETCRSFADERRAFLPPMPLLPAERIRSRALSTPAPGF